MNELIEFSGGGQGKAPKPPTKIQGTQWKWKVEKIKNIPKYVPPPQPKEQPKPKKETPKK